MLQNICAFPERCQIYQEERITYLNSALKSSSELHLLGVAFLVRANLGISTTAFDRHVGINSNFTVKVMVAQNFTVQITATVSQRS